jgi:hypothetical protein
MTTNAQHLPVLRRNLAPAQTRFRALTLRPVLARVATRALPMITASLTAVATVLTAERAVRDVASKLTPAEPVAPTTTLTTSARTVATEWLTVERRRRTR